MDKLIADYTPDELATIAQQHARDAVWHATSGQGAQNLAGAEIAAAALSRMDMMIRELARRAAAR